jgi:hypothetical protein
MEFVACYHRALENHRSLGRKPEGLRQRENLMKVAQKTFSFFLVKGFKVSKLDNLKLSRNELERTILLDKPPMVYYGLPLFVKTKQEKNM